MNKKIKHVWLAAACAGMMIFAAGCSTQEKTSNPGTNGSATSTVTGTTSSAATAKETPAKETPASGTTQPQQPASGVISNPPPAPAAGTDKLDVPPDAITQSVVYRSNKDATKLVKEPFSHAKMASESKRAYVIFDQLKKSGSGTVSAVPDYVQISQGGITIEAGVMTLNFNDGVTRLQGSTTETMFIDAVNKTMFENFADVKKIKYQINGKDAKVLTQMSVANGFVRK
jgi:hypothetical protein